MIINSIMPYVSLVLAFIVPEVKRKYDRSFGSNIYSTKQTTFASYKELYSGSDYCIHFKYSGILNIMFITMMYGVGMPILFPIAMFNFLNQYLCERIIIAYTMKLPPVLDDKLTQNALEMLKWAPLLWLFNGYWMLSNRQIFKNEYSLILNTKYKMLSNHFVDFDIEWASPLLIVCIASLFLISV